MTIQTLNGYAASGPPAAPPTSRGNTPVVEVQQKAADQQPAPVAPQQVEQALDKIKQVMSSKASALTFSVDDQSGDTIVRVVDSETGEVIRQIPSQELVEISRALDKMQGMLLKQSA